MKHIALLLSLIATPVLAAPVEYQFENETSRVQYRVDFGTSEIFGVMPVQSARVSLDFDRASNSSVDVTLNAARATASFPFAAEALKGPNVLNTAQHPAITFVSNAFRADGNRAEVDGTITIKGVSRPMTLRGGLFREQGQQAGDRSQLLVRLNGSVQRSAFGADGFADAVGDRVDIEIIARIRRP
ncbi:MAG: YceI family protein [Pseudomonadota bacterium]